VISGQLSGCDAILSDRLPSLKTGETGTAENRGSDWRKGREREKGELTLGEKGNVRKGDA
jgi:hypothetical protein